MGIQRKSSREMLVYKMTKEIESNLNDDQFGVDSLAQAVGMSRSTLHRKLHKLLGMSTSQFVREYRLKRALEILRQEDITASETAYRVGFSSATYFSTSFHKFYGYTPGEVKSRNDNEIETPIKSDSPAFEKNSVIKRAFWLVVATIALLTTSMHFYNANKEETKVTLASANEIKDKSIAVLPFKNLTGKPDLEYVSDGMTDAVISRLTKISAIDKVIPFTSTLQYKETKKTIKEIATELGVENLLQGNLQISGDKIKINLQLINGETNNHLWSEEYIKEWKGDEIFKIQTEVVEGIAANMNAIITDSELADVQKILTKSKQAYSYYLQGEFQKNKFNKLTYANAITLYKKAIAIDSNFVEAYVSMANIWSFGGLVWGIHDQRLAWSNAKILLQKALEIDPANEGAAGELNTGYFYYDWDFESVEKYYQSNVKDFFFDKTPAIAVDYATKTGKYEESIAALDHLISIDPTNGVNFSKKAEVLMLLGKNQEASDLLNNTYSLHGDHFFYMRESIKLNFYLGEYEKSQIQFDKLLRDFPDYSPILMWLNALYAQMNGDLKNTNKYLAELLNEYDKGSSGSPAWFMALYNSHIEDYEKTFDWLQKSYDRHEVEMTWLREEPLLAPLRNDPRYKDLYEKVGFSSIGLPIKTTSENQYAK